MNVVRSSGWSILLFLLAAPCVLAQSDTKPFAEFDKEVKQEQWDGNKERLSTSFNAERKRLGSSFESELLKYIDADIEKHYWISFFLEDPDYLHGSQSLPYLSLLIKEQGLKFMGGKSPNEESLGFALGLNASAAVLSEKLGLRTLAIWHKSSAEAYLQARPGLKYYFPAMSEDEQRVYQSLKAELSPTVYSTPPNVPSEGEPKTRMFGGILNGSASKLAIPKYPQAARADRASGTITVRIVVDETGSVIWARATEGHPALKEAAEKAAFQTKFRPPILEGKPEKISGLLIFRFVSQ